MPSSGASWLAWSGLVFDIDDLAAGRADDEIGRAGARRVGHRPRCLVEALGIQHLPAAYVERRPIGIAAVVARGQAVLDEADPAFVHAHLAAGDPGLGEADEARLVLAPGVQHEGAPVHALEPVPVLAEPGVAIGGDLAAAGRTWCSRRPRPHTSCFALSRRLLAEQGECELIACIEQRDRHFALAGAFGNPAASPRHRRGSRRRSPCAMRPLRRRPRRGRGPTPRTGADRSRHCPRPPAQTAGHARARGHGHRLRSSTAECSGHGHAPGTSKNRACSGQFDTGFAVKNMRQ